MFPVLVPLPVPAKTTVDPPVVRLFPAASLACSVSVAAAPETTVALDTVTTDVAGDTTPGVTAIVGSVEVTGLPPIVAPMVVALPATAPVNVAVYVPFPLSVVAAIAPVLVPPDAVNATVSPPAVRLLPAASLARRVRIALPPEMMLAADTVTVDCVVVAAPGTTVIVGSAEVTATLLIVAPIVVAVP